MSKTIKTEFQRLDTERSGIMQRARLNSALTIPNILPYFATGNSKSDTQNITIPTPHQGIGADGVRTISSKLLTAMFAPGLTWFQFTPSARLRAFADPALLEQFEGLLYIRELLLHAKLRSVGFTKAMRTQLEHIIVVGNSCFRVRDNYRIRSYRFDNWVQRKVDDELLEVILLECLDPDQLDDEQFTKANLKRADYEGRSGVNRLIDVYTRCKKQLTGSWVLDQEINGVTINTSEEPISPVATAGYVELCGESYSRSLIEEVYADLEQDDRISQALGDIAEAAAKYHPVSDPSKGWTPKIFKQPNGAVWQGRVSGGVPDGIGVWRVEKNNDIVSSANYLARVEDRLSKNLLIETNLQPTGDRVTRYQVERIAAELDSALGGVYANIADELQRPLVQRFEWQMDRDGELPPLPEELRGDVNTEILTGEAAISRQMQLNQMLQALQVVSQIPGAAQRIRYEVAAQMIFQGYQIDTRRLVKSDEEMAAEIQQAMQQRVAEQSANQTIQTAGKVVEKAAEKQLSE